MNSGKKFDQTLMMFFKAVFRPVNRILEEPLLTTFLVLMIIAIIVVTLSLPLYLSDSQNFYVNILSELHGMIFDLFVIGILIFWLNDLGQKRQRIRAYKDEIDDFRMWESEEAAFRTVGNIKRLNRHKIYDIDLVNCHLSRTNLSHVILRGANLNNANLSNSILIEANLEYARLNRTNFENTNLNQSNLNGAFASGTIFKDANMIKVSLHEAFLIKADFKNAFLMEADLSGANLTGVNFENANLYKADLRHARGLVIDQLLNVKTLYLAQFDEEIFEKLKRDHSELIGK